MAIPEVFVTALPVVAFGPATVNSTPKFASGVPAEFRNVARTDCNVPVTYGPGATAASCSVAPVNAGDALTVICMSSVPIRFESLPVRRNTYVPGVEKTALVERASISLKVTRPGPLNWLQKVVNVEPAGRPSSLAVPFRRALFGSVIVWFGPAFTIGAWFAGSTVTVTSSLTGCAESVAVRRKT